MLNKNSTRKLGIVATVLSMLACGDYKGRSESYGMSPSFGPSFILPEMMESNSVHPNQLNLKLEDLDGNGKYELHLSETRNDTIFTYRVQRDEKGRLTLTPFSRRTSYGVGGK